MDTSEASVYLEASGDLRVVGTYTQFLQNTINQLEPERPSPETAGPGSVSEYAPVRVSRDWSVSHADSDSVCAVES